MKNLFSEIAHFQPDARLTIPGQQPLIRPIEPAWKALESLAPQRIGSGRPLRGQRGESFESGPLAPHGTT
jgi:hypothetical protein